MGLSYTEWKAFETKLDLILTNQGKIMGTQQDIQRDVAATLQNQQDMNDILVNFITSRDAEIAKLKQQVLDAAAGDSAIAAQVLTLFQKSEEVENKMRAAIPGVPPVGGTPLLSSYADRASFDAAVAAYTGPEAVNLDGGEVKAGTAPALEYFSHSADGSVSTSGPTD